MPPMTAAGTVIRVAGAGEATAALSEGRTGRVSGLCEALTGTTSASSRPCTTVPSRAGAGCEARWWVRGGCGAGVVAVVGVVAAACAELVADVVTVEVVVGDGVAVVVGAVVVLEVVVVVPVVRPCPR
jgi:hypothetical protein